MIRNTLLALLLACAVVGAQGHDQEKMKKKMEEISQLMRESERLLLEITKVDRLVARQQEIVRKLKELEPPPANDAAAAQAHQQKVEELEKQQAEAAEKLGRLFEGQKQRAEVAVKELQSLLENWPKQQQQQGQGQGQKQQNKPKSKAEQEREKQLREKQKEQKQRQADSPRDKKDLFKDKPEGGSRTKDDKQAARALRAVQAWIAKLPPKQQERISRGDLSDIPMRYRRLVREYTALRAKREAEEREEDR